MISPLGLCAARSSKALNFSNRSKPLPQNTTNIITMPFQEHNNKLVHLNMKYDTSTYAPIYVTTYMKYCHIVDTTTTLYEKNLST